MAKMNQLSFENLEHKCLLEMTQNGIPFSGSLIQDGKIHRFSIGPNKKKKSEWYVAHSGISAKSNPYFSCTYGSWNCSQFVERKRTFKSWEKDTAFDTAERSHLNAEWKKRQELLAQELKALRDIAANEANRIWRECENTQPCESHLKYCSLKKIDPIGARFGNNPNGYPSIIIPIRNINGDIRSLQFISVGNAGTVYKTFLNDGEKSGNFFHFGMLADGNPISIGEGYATGCSIFQGYSRNQTVVVAFDCHNLSKVIEQLRHAYPNSPITICGDDDVESPNNPGRSKAEELAKKYQCKAAFPKFPSEFFLPLDQSGKHKRPTDWNDLFVYFGKSELQQQLLNLGPSAPSYKFTLAELEQALTANECGDAGLFKKQWGEDYIFDPDEKCFYVWRGMFWSVDKEMTRYQKLEIVADQYSLAANQMHSISSKSEKDKEQLFKCLQERTKSLKTIRRMKSVLEMASSGSLSNGGLAFDKVWDNATGYLPCANGLVDLKTGNLLEPRRNHFIRKNSPLTYDPSARCPLFTQFILEVMGGREHLAKFLKRLCGYISIGHPIEHIFVFFYGAMGRNGKGTLVRLISKALAHLARNLQSELLLQQRNPPSSGAARPDLINLEGTRFAFFSEINEGRTLDSAVVKNLSGGDRVVGRQLYQSEKDFSPTHTLVLQANHRPKAAADDHALWSRAILIPFDITFVKHPKLPNERKIDVHLEEKLERELPGILRWIVEGAIEYYQNGLLIPDEVRSAVEEYRTENDGIGMFIKEKCIKDSTFSTPRGNFTKAVQAFCLEQGFNSPNAREINAYMKNQGFKDRHTKKGDVWDNISIAPSNEQTCEEI